MLFTCTEDGGGRFLRNICSDLPDHAATCVRRQPSFYSLLRESGYCFNLGSICITLKVRNAHRILLSKPQSEDHFVDVILL
jgi:hypothetical protein